MHGLGKMDCHQRRLFESAGKDPLLRRGRRGDRICPDHMRRAWMRIPEVGRRDLGGSGII